ncbi:MAG: hydrogenase maturation protease [Planctomycetota bacterium]|nr:MAG: hydrogenase maturation protease [Planctomycetota bacterium]
MFRSLDDNRLRRVLVAGVGSSHGDDRLGWDAVQCLQRALHRSARHGVAGEVIVEQLPAPAELLDALERHGPLRRVIVCDAIGPGAVGGERGTGPWIGRWRWPAVPVERTRSASTHGIGLVDTLRTAEVLGRLPAEVVIVGMEGRRFGQLGELSPECRSRMPTLVQVLLEECRLVTVSPHEAADGGRSAENPNGRRTCTKPPW